MRMLRAFRDLGYDVDVVAGYAKERIAAIRVVKETLAADRHAYSFVYSESSTAPTLLTEPNHLPRHPLIDFDLLHKLRSVGTPVGLFYRDAFWHTDFYPKTVRFRYRVVTIPMYYYDLAQYRRSIDHLFIPNLKIMDLIPWGWPEGRFSTLPPGCDLRAPSPAHVRGSDSPLAIFFVGSIIPPMYDMREIIRAIADQPDVTLTICCRPREWEAYQALYLPLPANVSITHAHGEGLDALYRSADLAMINQVDWYQKVTVPVKFYEAISYGMPMVVVGESFVAKTVRDCDLGWVAATPEELPAVLAGIRSTPDALQRAREAVLNAQEANSWKSRASQAAETLLALRKSEH